MKRLSYLNITLIVMALICMAGLVNHAQGEALTAPTMPGFEVSPSAATANSVYRINFIYKNEDGLFPVSLIVYVDNVAVIDLVDRLEVNEISDNDGQPLIIRLSAGLNTHVTGTHPADPNDADDLEDVIYHSPLLIADTDAGSFGNPKARTIKIVANYMSDSGDLGADPVVEPTYTDLEVSGTVTVHDSFTGEVGYGGVEGSRDWLAAYPYRYPNWVINGSYPFRDPLTVIPTIPQFPDEGTSSSDYIFRVNYFNTDGRFPARWGNYDPDYEAVKLFIGPNNITDSQNINTVVYMYREDTDDTSFTDSDGVPYIKYILPIGTVSASGNQYARCPWYFQTSWQLDAGSGNYRRPWYISLKPGKYQYFFSCTDDDIRHAPSPGDFYPSAPYIPAEEDGIYGQINDGFWGSHIQGFNTSTLLDMPTYFPGPAFETHWTESLPNGYPFPSWDSWLAGDTTTYPIVNPGLEACYENSTIVPYFGPFMQEYPLGGGRFLGTMYPYKFAVNPLVPNQTGFDQNQSANGVLVDWSDTSTITENGQVEFRVVYRQSGGWTPAGVWLNVYNDWYPTGTPTKYSMTLASAVYNDPDGHTKWAIYKKTLGAGTQLSRGPHCYYFEASDGVKTSWFPRRPDTVTYDGATWYDGYCPGGIGNSQGCPENNDVINGPYVNRKCTLTAQSVSPVSGPSGTDFVFRVTYTDLDGYTVAQNPTWTGPRGQRPYTANVIIQTEDGGTLANGGAVRCTMQKEDPTDTDYTNGAVYVLHTASVPGLVLQPGTRHYYFEFVDDWGRQTDPNLRISGELTTLTQGPYGFAGPQIAANTKPVLYSGSCTSPDGSNNSATLWKYQVTYKDANNQPPVYMNVYIGRVDPDSGELTWDNGHEMVAANPNDTVYSDGKVYTYSTRLIGDAGNPVNYYYCFVASDGIDVAEYNSSTSPSAHTVWNNEVLTGFEGSDQLFSFARSPIVAGIPSNVTNYTEPLIYVDGTRQYSGFTFDNLNGQVTFTDPVEDEATAKYWFGVPGPTALGANNPPVLSAGKVLPATGDSSTLFTYTVKYKDTDGTTGQPPSYIKVIIDGQIYDMTPSLGDGGNFKQGVEYRYQTTLANGLHTFYFEASDGEDYAVFDAEGSKSSDAAPIITAIAPITGPNVNDLPTLTDGAIVPNDLINGHSTGQYFQYLATYTDQSNDAPDAGYPVVYIDNPTEEVYEGTVTAVDEDAMTITDTDQDWTVDEFAGLPVEVTGDTGRTIFIIGNNDADTLTLITSSVEGVSVGDTFSIGKLIMEKVDPSDNDYTDGVVYSINIPGLGVRKDQSNNVIPHTAHFRSVTDEGFPGRNPVSLREPQLVAPNPPYEEIDGPLVNKEIPEGNTAPVLASILNTGVDHTPGTGISATEFTFSVKYADADGDEPIIRDAPDNVIGYVRLMIRKGTTGSFTPYSMTVVPGAPDYVEGAEFRKALSSLTPGTYYYHFEASDGWYVVRYPAIAERQLHINRPPVLSSPSVTPTRGNTGMSYLYSVTYTDLDGDPPASMKVIIDDVESDIINNGTGLNYTTGVVYSHSNPAGSMTEGTHKFKFTTADPVNAAVSTDEINEPVIYTNTVPGLNGGAVSPTSGYDTDTYTYTVTYTDPDGDAPEYVKVYIDETTEAHANIMTKGSSNNFVNGVTYTFAKQGLAAELDHKFFFKASDYMATVYDPENAPTNRYTGPVVEERPTAVITVQCSSPITVGQTTVISGTITKSDSKSVNLKIKLTSPSGTLPDVTVTSNALGNYTYSWTPNKTGTWKVQTTWAGADNYLASSSVERSVVVNGLSYTVNGLDMISLPITPISGFPDAALGYDPLDPASEFALAKWIPADGAYKLYSRLSGYRTDFDFPWITPGQSYWIKTNTSKTITANGTLVSTASDYTINLGVGWNQVGCPFMNNVNWNSLQIRYGANLVSLSTAAANGWVRDYGWRYDTSTANYKLVDTIKSSAERTMQPWKGYWIKAFVACQLVIPVSGIDNPPDNPLSAGPAKEMSETMSAGVRGTGWQVQLIAQNGNTKDEYNYFGINSLNAERMESPYCMENYVDLYFTNEKDEGVYASDVRKSIAAGETWYANVATDKSGNVKLTWNGLENVPSNIKLTLVDDETNESTLIIPRGSYSYKAEVGKSRPFRIIAGYK